MAAKFCYFLFFVLFSCRLYGQYSYTGQVTDHQHQPLAFVNILIEGDPHQGVITDLEGRFEIRSDHPLSFLELSYVGYETIRYTLADHLAKEALRIVMHRTTVDLTEAVVLAGENPAHRIIRAAVRNRDRNNPKKLGSFSCTTYNKFTYQLLPDSIRYQKHREKKPAKSDLAMRRDSNMQRMMLFADSFNLLVVETVTQQQFRSPGSFNERVILNRLSGFERAEIAALAKDIQPFSFYGDFFEILGKTFLNPVSPGSFRKYFFELKDTLYQGLDSIFIIAFRPGKGKDFSGLQGVLYIHSNQYAIQNVIAQPFDKGMMDIRIEQKYAWVDERQWFPEQIHFEAKLPKYPGAFLGMGISGRTHISNVLINPPLDTVKFDNMAYSLTEEAFTRADSVWATYRPEPLKPKEIRTYVHMDSLGRKYKLDKRLNQLTALSLGRFPVGKWDLQLKHFFRTNYFEGTRLGIGLMSNRNLSTRFTVGAFAGYGVKDKLWKYGTDLVFNLRRQPAVDLHFLYRHTIGEPALFELPGLSHSLISRNFYARNLDNIESFNAGIRSDLFTYGRLGIMLQTERRHPNYPYTFAGVGLTDGISFRFTEVIFRFRYAFGEQFIPLHGERIAVKTNYPILQFSYARGIPKWLKGNFAFDRFLFGIEQTFKVRNLGNTNYRLEAGWVTDNVPYARLFVGSGIGTGFELFKVDQSFQTMGLYEFLSDTFLHIFIEHSFNTFLYRHKFSKPYLSLVQNIGYGKLSHPELHQQIEFKTMEKGFLESGVVINNILRLPYLNLAYFGLGAGIYYRYGPNRLPGTADNFAYRLAIEMEF